MSCDIEPEPFLLKSTERFEVQRSVSGGGYGDVWVAFDKTLALTIADGLPKSRYCKQKSLRGGRFLVLMCSAFMILSSFRVAIA